MSYSDNALKTETMTVTERRLAIRGLALQAEVEVAMLARRLEVAQRMADALREVLELCDGFDARGSAALAKAHKAHAEWDATR